MKKISLLFILIILVALPKSDAYNILGGSIGYKFLSSSGESSTYRVTVELFATCLYRGPGTSDVNMNADLEIYVLKNGVRVDRPLLHPVASESRQDITPLCPTFINQTTCKNPENPYFSVIKYVYSNDIVITGTDANWSFAFNGIMMPYARLGVFAYLDNVDAVQLTQNPPPVYDNVYLVATLNNLNGPNSSPEYSGPPAPYFCKNHKSYYSVGAADPDLDKLKYKLIPARTVLGAYNTPEIVGIDYNAPYTGQQPLPLVPDSFYMNPDNGQMIFTPDSEAICLVVVQTDEYKGDQLVGSSMRQMMFQINTDCDAAPPSTPVENIQHADHVFDEEGNLYLSACEGLTDTVSFDVDVTDPNNDKVLITSDNIPNAANVSIENNNSLNPVVHFKWDLTDAAPVTYFFYLTYTDDGCPMATSKNIAYTFTVVPHNIKFENGSSGSCLTGSDGKAWVNPIGETAIDYTYKWVDTATGNILRNVSSKTGDTLKNVPPGIYKVYVRNLDGCGKNFFIKVDTTLLPKLDLPNDTTICKGMYLDISTEPEIATTYQWNTGLNECCFKATEGGAYTVTATNHCGSSTASVNLDVVKCNYCFFVPNAFTPNGDGNNDVFKITPTCLTYKYKLFIYNRWGQLVFNSYDLQQSWDGTYKGQEAQQGTYYYVLDAILDNPEHEKVHLTGDVNVIK